MLQRTRGIFLHKLNYSETSVIARIYTEAFGLQAFMIRGVRKRKARFAPGLLQPLSLLELVVYYKEKNQLQNVKELRSAEPYTSLPYDIKKSMVAVFINEVLNKTLKEEEANPGLFEFLFSSFLYLDRLETGYANFHLMFLLKLSEYLGFYPALPEGETGYFDLQEGEFSARLPMHPHYMNRELSALLLEFMHCGFVGIDTIKLSGNRRNQFLEQLLLFYGLHVPGFGELKSHQILRSLLND